MPLQSPNLDDRSFQDLVDAASRLVRERSSEWTDLNPGDPGRTLIEAFACLTETMIHRLNRLPEKAYVEFLNLMGVQQQAPAAASVALRFELRQPPTTPVEIPEETHVVSSQVGEDGEPVVFVTARSARIDGGERAVVVLAHHCELCSESTWQGTGRPGLVIQISRPPMIAPLPDQLDLFVGVEVREDEVEALPHGTAKREYAGKAYRIWTEASLAELDESSHTYTVDRVSGRIAFLSTPPAEGRDIRVWYRRGGGEAGNVGAGTIDRARSPLPPGLLVHNPRPSTGGRDAEPIEAALERGPREINSLARVVTARDYELTALRASGSISRALPYTVAEAWAHGRPGTVELVLVPRLPRSRMDGPAVRLAQIEAEQEAAGYECERVKRTLAARQPLGTHCDVRWARYKEVRVEARVVAHRAENREELQERLAVALERLINPLPDGDGNFSDGWAFGESLRRFNIHALAQREPGVKYIEELKLIVSHAPDRNVRALVPDAHQSRTWFAGGDGELFRTSNGGQGWERIWHREGTRVQRVAVHPNRPGLVAILVVDEKDGGTEIHTSRNCGEGFRLAVRHTSRVRDLAWLPSEGEARLLLAGDAGLHSLADEEGAVLLEVPLAEGQETPALYAVATGRDSDGTEYTAVAAQRLGGVYLSHQGGRPNSFRALEGLHCKEIRGLAIHEQPAQTFLWAAAHPSRSAEMGFAVQSWHLMGERDPAEGWRRHASGWDAGSCHDLAFDGSRVFAASGSGGVMTLPDHNDDNASWTRSSLNSNLPISAERDTLATIHAVGFDARQKQLMASHDEGVHLRDPDTDLYRSCCSREAGDEVTLSRSWLFCSGEHSLTVDYEDEGF